MSTAPESVRPAGHQINVRSQSPDTEQMRVLRAYTSTQQISDPFKAAYGVVGGSWMTLHQPPYSFYALMKMPQDNSTLNQCIDAMVTNIDGHGYRLEYIGEDGQGDGAIPKVPGDKIKKSRKLANTSNSGKGEMSTAAQAEKRVLEDLLNFPNDDYSMQELRDRVRRDYETIGNAYIEVGRDALNRVVMMSHVPAHTIRLSNRETEAVQVEVVLPREGGKEMKRKVNKRFRRFVQMIGNKRVYFKEYGDPRAIDPVSGDVKSNAKSSNGPDTATELLHLCTYNPDSPYGLPRWFNQIRNILGTSQAEMVNLDFFRDNAIPAMMLLVAGGAVTQGSIDALTDHFNSIRGRGAMQRIMVIEATGDSSAADNDGKVPPPKVELKPLTHERQTDATFLEYDKSGRDKIRSSFRLPPLFIGRSEDHTHATAKSSYQVAEGQVFAPERTRFDDMINLKVLSTYQPKYWSFKSNPPRLTDQDALVNSLSALDSAGALSPNIAINIANDMFDLEIPPVEEDWGDAPFALTTQLISSGKLKVNLQNEEPPAPLAPVIGAPGDKLAPGDKAKPGDKGPSAVPDKGSTPVKDPVGPDGKPLTKAERLADATTKAMLSLHDQLRDIRKA